MVLDAHSGKTVADIPGQKRNHGVALAPAAGQFEVVQTVQTPRGARTMGLDPTTHTLYLPTAEFDRATAGQRRPAPKPDSFMVVVVSPSSP
jgi:hypothetical protein